MHWKKIVELNKKKDVGYLKYCQEFNQAAIEVLSEKAFQSKTHLAKELNVSKRTIGKWMSKYPEFKKAVEVGLTIGEAKTRDAMMSYAFVPAKNINNGLVLILAQNIYGISSEQKLIIEEVEKKENVESFLKERGIPVPKIEIPDIDLVDSGDTDVEKEMMDDIDNFKKKTVVPKYGKPSKW